MYKNIKRLLFFIVITVLVINSVFSIMDYKYDEVTNKQNEGCYNVTNLSQIYACNFIIQNSTQYDKSNSYKVFFNYIVLLFILCAFSTILIKKQINSIIKVVIIPFSILETTLNYIHSTDGQKASKIIYIKINNLIGE